MLVPPQINADGALAEIRRQFLRMRPIQRCEPDVQKPNFSSAVSDFGSYLYYQGLCRGNAPPPLPESCSPSIQPPRSD